jgi:hypothetical protein
MVGSLRRSSRNERERGFLQAISHFMPKRVATIETVFSIDGIGTVIALPNEAEWTLDPKERIHRRERVQIRTQSGGCLSTFIREIEMVNRGRERCGIAFSLPRSVTPEDIPSGSELWLERDGTEPLIEP